jgi:hypothetical protein
MQAARILPASCPDTVDDVADGATFYLDPATYPLFTGDAFIATGDLSAAKDSRLCVRLVDGQAFHLTRAWPCRVVSLVAEVSGEDW